MVMCRLRELIGGSADLLTDPVSFNRIQKFCYPWRPPQIGFLAALLVSPRLARAQSAYVDPAGSGPIVGAVHWIQGTLLGTVATVIAVIAVAAVGLMMLTGRMNWRFGATVIVGCFIVFGATSIVAGIQAAAGAGY